MTRRATVTNIDTLQVACWCERHVIRLPRDHVRAGITGACGHPDCHPPEETTHATVQP